MTDLNDIVKSFSSHPARLVLHRSQIHHAAFASLENHPEKTKTAIKNIRLDN